MGKVVHHRNVTESFHSYGMPEVLEKDEVDDGVMDLLIIKVMKEKMEEMEGELVRNKVVIQDLKKRENVLYRRIEVDRKGKGEMVQTIKALQSELEGFKKRMAMEKEAKIDQEEGGLFKLYDIYE